MEIDFVAVSVDAINTYQVSWDNINLRHEVALGYFYTVYPQTEEVVFTNLENAAEFVFVDDFKIAALYRICLAVGRWCASRVYYHS